MHRRSTSGRVESQYAWWSFIHLVSKGSRLYAKEISVAYFSRKEIPSLLLETVYKNQNRLSLACQWLEGLGGNTACSSTANELEQSPNAAPTAAPDVIDCWSVILTTHASPFSSTTHPDHAPTDVVNIV